MIGLGSPLHLRVATLADIDVVIGDMFVENFPKLDDFLGEVFFRRLGNAVNFKIVFSGVLL